jgi:hypothetical protein
MRHPAMTVCSEAFRPEHGKPLSLLQLFLAWRLLRSGEGAFTRKGINKLSKDR